MGRAILKAMAHTIEIDFHKDLPAWRLRIVQPERFRAVETSLQVRLFKMPRGALLAVLLKLYDVPEQPYFAHRVMDLSDERVSQHARLCAAEGRMLLLFEAMGVQGGFTRALALDRAAWERVLEDGASHNRGRAVDPDAALDEFLRVFEPASRRGGVEAGWAEVDQALEKPA